LFFNDTATTEILRRACVTLLGASVSVGR
jgi:hypothetical protein